MRHTTIKTRRVIRTDDNKNLKKLLLKLSKEVSINDSSICGTITIISYRKYQFSIEEVDVIFEGKIFAQTSEYGLTWYHSSILTNKSMKVSMVLVNRFIRKQLFRALKPYLAAFDIELRTYHNIKKITWK